MNTSKQFYMWGMEAEVIIRVKHENGTAIEVPVSDVTSYIRRDHMQEIRIPVRGEWFNRLVETTDYSSFKKGR